MAKTATLALCLLAVVALVYMAGGANAQTCTTGGGSPSVGDADNVVNYIRGLGTTSCCQQTCSGAFCTVMHTSGSAEGRICGNCNECVTCSTAGNALGAVVGSCVENGLVSGSEFTSGFEFQLISSGSGLDMVVEE